MKAFMVRQQSGWTVSSKLNGQDACITKEALQPEDAGGAGDAAFSRFDLKCPEKLLQV